MLSHRMAIYTFHLILTIFTIISASDFSLKDDPCSKFDSCHSKSKQRTCSCADDCYIYGTCCSDSSSLKSSLSSIAFRCYDHRTVSPVFVKRACAQDFHGLSGNIQACFEDEVDEMDVKDNLIVTSRRTKITYWNLHCALCSNEDKDDLKLWNVEVFCPPRNEVDKRMIRRNLTLNKDKNAWGLNMSGEFLQCHVKYSPPPSINEVKYCTPNLISSCPANYNNEDVASKCPQYYAERRLKNSDKYYMNVHCAICNGVDVKDLDCPGMNPEDIVDENDFREMVEEVFTSGEWLQKESGRKFQCSQGFNYNPFWKKCARFEEKKLVVMTWDSSESCTIGMASLSTAFLLLFLHFVFNRIM